VTEANFRTHFPEKRAQFIASDLLSTLPTSYLTEGHPVDISHTSSVLFLTNLPYIRSEDWIHMSADTVHEPRLALFGGEQTGFEMYERLFAQIAGLQLAHFQLLCEFGFDQREIAESVLRGYPEWQSSFFTDYAGIERFAEVSL
jgi:methylase of polypeptide subunit release factors